MNTKKMISYFALFIIFLILFSLYGFWVATHPPRYITNLTPKDLGWEYEEVSLTAQDNIKLSSWFVPFDSAQGKPSDKVIILLHGYPADKADLLSWSKFLHQDFNLFFLDFRYFGSSQGSLTTLGLKEQLDLQAAISYLKGRDFSKIGAMGLSLGGATALMTAASKQDSELKAIVSESSFANIDLMGYEFYRNLFFLKYPLTSLTKLWAKILLGVDISNSPEKAALSLKIPILIIHSKQDDVISFENAQRLQVALRNNQKAQFLFFDEGMHGGVTMNSIKLYEEKIVEFFNKNL